jgi:hypothetical protein
MTDPMDDLTDALRRMPREAIPPAAVEEATLSRLRTAGFIRPRTSRWRGGLIAAALLAAFGLGHWSARPGFGRPDDTAVATWALMLYGAGSADAATHAQRAEEYGAWARAAHADGQVMGGEALGSGGPVVSGAGEGPPAELPVGYFLVRARDRQAAARLARECPHLKYGGRIVIQEVLPS